MTQTHKKIRVLVCDKYTLFREGIKALLKQAPSIEIVGEATTAAEAIEQLERLKLDVVLIDVAMPDLTGFEATRLIKAIDPHVKVLVLSIYDDEALISGCLEAGASGYIGKHHRAAQLQSAIGAVCRIRDRAA